MSENIRISTGYFYLSSFDLAKEDIETLAVAGAVVTFGLAMLSDWDQRIPFVPYRGVTHTVHFAVAVGVILGFVGVLLGLSNGILTGVALGSFGFVTIGSHIAAALTPMGVEPYRDCRRYSFDVVRAVNPIANYPLLVLGVVAVIIAYKLDSRVASLIGV